MRVERRMNFVVVDLYLCTSYFLSPIYQSIYQSATLSIHPSLCSSFHLLSLLSLSLSFFLSLLISPSLSLSLSIPFSLSPPHLSLSLLLWQVDELVTLVRKYTGCTYFEAKDVTMPPLKDKTGVIADEVGKYGNL